VCTHLESILVGPVVPDVHRQYVAPVVEPYEEGRTQPADKTVSDQKDFYPRRGDSEIDEGDGAGDKDGTPPWARHLPSDLSKNSTALPLSHMMAGRISRTFLPSVSFSSGKSRSTALTCSANGLQLCSQQGLAVSLQKTTTDAS